MHTCLTICFLDFFCNFAVEKPLKGINIYT